MVGCPVARAVRRLRAALRRDLPTAAWLCLAFAAAWAASRLFQ